MKVIHKPVLPAVTDLIRYESSHGITVHGRMYFKILIFHMLATSSVPGQQIFHRDRHADPAQILQG